MLMGWRAFTALATGLILGACVGTPPRPAPEPPAPVLRYLPGTWRDLPGWNADDTRAAWPALLASCASPRMPAAWGSSCTRAQAINAGDAAAQRAWVESQLRPWRIILESDGRPDTRQDKGLITGYYEPVLNGARQRGGSFQTPLYGVPDDLVTVELGELYPALQGERIRG